MLTDRAVKVETELVGGVLDGCGCMYRMTCHSIVLKQVSST